MLKAKTSLFFLNFKLFFSITALIVGTNLTVSFVNLKTEDDSGGNDFLSFLKGIKSEGSLDAPPNFDPNNDFSMPSAAPDPTTPPAAPMPLPAAPSAKPNTTTPAVTATPAAPTSPIASAGSGNKPEAPKTEALGEKNNEEKLEQVSQVDRDWSQDGQERTLLKKNADDYYKKITALEQKSNEAFNQKEDAYENLSQELNKTYSQASDSMGRFVEVGRKIEGYVQQTMTRYTN